MKALADLEERIRDLLINNYWDINIHDYPDILAEAKMLGLDERQLNQKVIEIDTSIDKRPYAIVDKVMEEPISTGIVQDKDVRKALEAVEGKVSDGMVVSYVIHKIRRHLFEPRNRVPLDWSSFKNPWMTLDAWKKFQETHLEVEWLGEKARTLEEMGEISFRKKEDAQYYTRNNHYLPTLITILTKNPAKADAFSKIIDAEQDPEVRYLNIIYRLNPSLSFRFHGARYRSIVDLVNVACGSSEAFWALAEMYRKKYIHVWLNEINAPAKIHLTAERDINGFLTFIYRVNNQYPFYLKQSRFNTPASLILEARKNTGIWPDLATVIQNGNLQTWFDGIGQTGLNTALASGMLRLDQSKLYSVDDKKLASVQVLINVVDPTVEVPAVEATPSAISKLSVEAGRPVIVPLKVKLANEGFLKMSVYPDQQIDGIAINRNAIDFYSQAGKIEEVLYISIDPMKLIKDRKYQLNILLGSIYETTRIPVELRVVFPKKAFLIHLAKYGFFGAIFFGVICLFIQYISSSIPISTYSGYLNLNWSGWVLPFQYLAYIVPVALLVAGLIFSIFIIRKIEKV